MRNSMFTTALLSLLSATFVGCSESSDTASTPTATDPVATNPVEATPVSFANTKCPIMGGSPTDELTAEYDGRTIGFCCDGCPEKWAELSDDLKAEKFAKVDAHAGHNHADGDHDHSDHSGE